MGTADEVREVSYAEGAELFDKTASRLLGMSGAEALERYDAGLLDWDSHPGATSVAMLIPFVRPHTGPATG